MALTMDSFLISLGKPGRYQMIAFFLLWSNTYPIAFNNFVMVFYGLTPKHHCKVPTDSPLLDSNETLPFNNDTNLFQNPPPAESCSIYSAPQNKTIPCPNGWDYDPEFKSRSIVPQWDLVCTNKWQLSVGISIYFIGVMLGGLVGGFLADRFGRQPVILVSIYIQTILGICVVFITNYIAFVAVRFFQAIFMQCLQACSFTLIMEMFQPKARAKASSFSSLGWTSALVVVALIAWVLEDWKHVHLVISIPSVISFTYFWFTPESMRWLIAHQHVDRAEALALKIANFNKIKPTEDVRKQVEQLSLDCANRGQNNSKQAGLIDLVRTPQIRKYTIINAFVWFTASIVTYGIAYGLSSIASNIYLSIVISGCVELPVRGLSFLVLQKYGRRMPIVITLALSGISCIIVPIIIQFGGNSAIAKHASTVAAIVGKAFMGLTFAIIPIYTVELYPTVIRTFGQGSAVFFSRIGGIVAPQLALLGDVLWKPAPFLVCGICGIVAALLNLMLPDTHQRPMPDMIEEVENQFKRKSIKGKEAQNLIAAGVQRHSQDGFKMATVTNGFIKAVELVTKDAETQTGTPNEGFVNEDRPHRKSDDADVQCYENEYAHEEISHL